MYNLLVSTLILSISALALDTNTTNVTLSSEEELVHINKRAPSLAQCKSANFVHKGETVRYNLKNGHSHDFIISASSEPDAYKYCGIPPWIAQICWARDDKGGVYALSQDFRNVIETTFLSCPEQSSAVHYATQDTWKIKTRVTGNNKYTAGLTNGEFKLEFDIALRGCENTLEGKKKMEVTFLGYNGVEPKVEPVRSSNAGRPMIPVPPSNEEKSTESVHPSNDMGPMNPVPPQEEHCIIS